MNGMNILHITAHLGGGVGRAISALVTEERTNTHRILCLECAVKRQPVQQCTVFGVVVVEKPSSAQLAEAIGWCDVVVLHWWAHPVMAGVLAHFPAIPVRLVIWCHISGCTYPALPFALLNKAQMVFFTSPYSYENCAWSAEQLERMRQKSRVLYGVGTLQKGTTRQDYALRDTEYVVGYAGTFARSKLHPGFVHACSKILTELPNTIFLLAGDQEEGKWISEEAQALGISIHIKFQGYVLDMERFWHQCDIFGYPLNPFHFGTTENSILEAMNAGLPVVLLEQATEKYILPDPSIGILAHDLEDYARQVVTLSKDADRRMAIGQAAASFIRRTYDHSRIVHTFQVEMERLSAEQKKPVQFQDVLGSTPIEWLLSIMPSWMQKQCTRLVSGEMAGAEIQKWVTACPYILKEPSKSSIRHFARIFPQDKALKKLELSLNQYG